MKVVLNNGETVSLKATNITSLESGPASNNGKPLLIAKRNPALEINPAATKKLLESLASGLCLVILKNNQLVQTNGIKISQLPAVIKTAMENPDFDLAIISKSGYVKWGDIDIEKTKKLYS